MAGEGGDGIILIDTLTPETAASLSLEDKQRLLMELAARKLEILREMRPLREGHGDYKKYSTIARTLPPNDEQRAYHINMMGENADAFQEFEDLIFESKVLTSIQSAVQTSAKAEMAAMVI